MNVPLNFHGDPITPLELNYFRKTAGLRNKGGPPKFN